MRKDKVVGVRITAEEKQDGKRKSGILPLSAVMRRLFQMWLNGEIQLTLVPAGEQEEEKE